MWAEARCRESGTAIHRGVRPGSWRHVSHSYVSRVLKRTLLAPDLVEAILDGRQPRGLTAQELLGGVPVGWREQRMQARR